VRDCKISLRECSGGTVQLRALEGAVMPPLPSNWLVYARTPNSRCPWFALWKSRKDLLVLCCAWYVGHNCPWSCLQ